MTDRFDNLAEPITLSDTEVQRFIQTRRCGLCGSHFNAIPTAEYHRYEVHCPEHGAMYPHSTVHVYTMDEVKAIRRQAARELQPDRPPRPISEILKELGF